MRKHVFRPGPFFALALLFTSLLPACADTIYITDSTANVIYQYSTNGTGSVFARSSLYYPEGIAYDQAGNLYVANFEGNTIFKFATNGTPSLFAADPGDHSVLDGPVGLAFDTSGNLYAANSLNNTVEMFGTNGTPSVFISGSVYIGSLNNPQGIAFDSSGNLFVANNNQNTGIYPGGPYIEVIASDGTDQGIFAIPDPTYLTAPVGLAFDASGNLYVANSLSVAASPGPSITKYDKTGNASTFTSTGLDDPSFLAFDTNGYLYVANSGFHSNNVVRISPNGSTVTAFSPANYLSSPTGLAFDARTNLFVANDIAISEIAPGGTVTLFAMTSLDAPRGITMDSHGNLYVGNYGDNTIMKYDTNATSTLFANMLGLTPRGLAMDSSNNLYVSVPLANRIMKFDTNGAGAIYDSTTNLHQPTALAFDSLGNLYCANTLSNVLTKFDTTGHSSVFATTALLTNGYGPGLAIDSSNNIYVLTNYWGVGFGKYSPAGVLTSFAANDLRALSTLANAEGIGLDNAGNLYVANYYEGTIREFNSAGQGSTFASGFSTPMGIYVQRTKPLIPTLYLTAFGTNAVLTWTLAATNFTLQTSTNLASNGWAAVTGFIGPSGTNYIHTNRITGPARFFRLLGN